MNYKYLAHHMTLATLLLVLSSCFQLPDQSTVGAMDTSTKISAAANVDTAAVAAEDTAQLNNGVLHPQTEPFTEDFEQAGKGKATYVKGELITGKGSWLLADALLGGTDADRKNGEHAVRIRNSGQLTMSFDVLQARSIRVMYAVYGNDGPSAWQLWVSKDGGANYEQTGETISADNNTLTAASFVIDTKVPVRFQLRKTGGGKNRLNIDDIEIDALRQQALVVKTQRPERQVILNNRDDDNLLLGNPSAATSSVLSTDNYLIDHQYYVESYSKKNTAPNWVSWHISAKDLGGAKRNNDFRADQLLPRGWYGADQSAYKGSGFDKGHNCPSGDRTSSSAANSSTFLMSNMIPQAPNNNQHTWEHLESYCRDQVKRGNEIYVVMGSYGSGGTGLNGYRTTIDAGRINVPAHIWKVVVIIPNGNDDLLRINKSTQVIAIDTPNENTVSANWMNYVCAVRDIEKATGYNLLSALPQAVQDIVETSKYKGGN